MRIGWDEYFINIAEVVSTRSTCPRLNVGCVLVQKYLIIATGFNGSIHGFEHCTEVGCLINEEGRCIRTLHAEENAIIHANRDLMKGAFAYVTHEPCEKCTKLLVQSGIKKIFFKRAYPNKWNKYFVKNIEFIHLDGEPKKGI